MMMQKFNPAKTKYLRLADAALSIFFHEKKAGGPLDMQKARDILVIDAGLIGDMVMSIPFLKTLRRNAPRAKITLVCGGWAEAVLKGQGLADDYIFMDTGAFSSPAGMLRKGGQLREALRQVNRKYYDIALEPRGDLRYILFMHFCRAGRKAGYSYTGGEYLLTDVATPPEKAVHLVEDRLYFAKSLGCRVYRADLYPELALTAGQMGENRDFMQEHGLLGKQVIGIHPGASLRIKQWGGFPELATRLAGGPGQRAFLIFEGPGEQEAAEEVAVAVRGCGAQAVVSRTGLTQYMQRLALCHAVFCNDSGAGHIARAYGVAVFVIFGPVEPAFARPYARDRVYAFSDSSLACKPCFRAACPRAHTERARAGGCECLGNVGVPEVYRKYEEYEGHCGSPA